MISYRDNINMISNKDLKTTNYISQTTYLELFTPKPKLNLTSLDNVIGLQSVKEELYYYFDFIDNSEKYNQWNIKIPKGILLVGPPGTGKTLLVKSIAKNSDIHVIHVTGSEFIEMYVGVGASRVRKLFANARSHKKCIIFIDEIDAIGKKRGSERNSERDQTLNQILTEMDGFHEDESIIMVFAATNLVSILDPALLRSGRFDKKIYFDLPNKEERIELYKLYINTNNRCTASKNNFDEYIEFDYEYLSNISVGLSGADIANVVNQAKINAIKNKKIYFNDNDIVHAIDEIMIGREKPERTVLPLELERISYHEAGHAFMSYILDGIEAPLKVSILPRGESALGFSLQKPVDIKLHTNNYLIKQLLVLLAGRSSEKVFYNNLSSGAYDDINKITNIVESYFKDFGMSEKYGPINFNKLGNYENNINKDIIDFIQNLEQICYTILTENKKSLIIISELLLKKETIDYVDIINNLNQTLENSIDYSI